MFKVGDEIKFSEEGLRRWGGTTSGKRADKYRKWRWRILELAVDKIPTWLVAVRLDIISSRPEVWDLTFFELGE